MTVPERHPIVLADSPRTLDVFVTGTGHIDPRQGDDVDGCIALAIWEKRVRFMPDSDADASEVGC